MKRLLFLMLLLSVVACAQPDPPTPTEREAGFLFRQGLELLDEGQLSRAEDLFRRALRLEPERLEIRPYLAQTLTDRGDHEGALRQLELYLDQEPSDAKVALLRVHTLVALERYGQASDALERYRLEHQDSWEWHNLRGFLYQEDGQPEAAEAAYKKAIELAPEDEYEPSTNLIALWVSLGRLDDARNLVTEMVAEAKDNALVLNALALVLSRQDPGFDPRPILGTIAEERLPFELHYNLSAALAERQETSQAAILAADLVDRYPADWRALWLYGRILLQQRELKDAGEYLIASHDKIPDSHEVAPTMGFYSYLMGDFDEAESWFLQALEERPDDADTTHNLSLVLSRLDRLDEAREASLKAVALDDSEPRYVYQLAVVFDRLGEKKEALTYYRRFLEVNGDAAQAAIVQEHIDELEGKL